MGQTKNSTEFKPSRRLGQIQLWQPERLLYHSLERGLDKHTNGLARQYLPKHQRLDNITNEVIVEIEHLLNNRPKKVLQYRTPLEVFNEYKSKSSLVAMRRRKVGWNDDYAIKLLGMVGSDKA